MPIAITVRPIKIWEIPNRLLIFIDFSITLPATKTRKTIAITPIITLSIGFWLTTTIGLNLIIYY